MVAAVNLDEWWRDHRELSELKVIRKMAQLSSEVQPDEKSVPDRDSDRGSNDQCS